MTVSGGGSAERAPRPAREDYALFRDVPTRWMDNDVYRHVNNVVYYSYFDTLVNAFLIETGILDVEKSPVIGFVVESGCRYHAPATFPEVLSGGLRVGRIGRSSVRYECALFSAREALAMADGHFIHVYVDRETHRPTDIPEPFRAALAPLVRS